MQKQQIHKSDDKPTDTQDTGGDEPRYKRKAAGAAVWIAGGLVLGIGWLGILHINRWYVGPPVYFLWLGWLGVVLTAYFLWSAGMSAAYDEDSDIDDVEFWRPVGRYDELLREKRSLLKALKELEFDHEMGKMSDQDAAELSHFYRSRAIEIIKTLESGDRDLSIPEKIEQEIKARMALDRSRPKPVSGKSRGRKKAKGDGVKNGIAKEKNGTSDSSEASESNAGANTSEDQMTDTSVATNSDEPVAASAEVAS